MNAVIDKVDAGFCSGIVEGTMWSLQIAKLVCLPNGMTLGQGLKVLVKYMDEQPQNRTSESASPSKQHCRSVSSSPSPSCR
jgi:hypothetical protein